MWEEKLVVNSRVGWKKELSSNRVSMSNRRNAQFECSWTETQKQSDGCICAALLIWTSRMINISSNRPLQRGSNYLKNWSNWPIFSVPKCYCLTWKIKEMNELRPGVTQLQAQCRGYLARKRLVKLKVPCSNEIKTTILVSFYWLFCCL